MKRTLLFLLLFGSQAFGQSLQSINYNYLYDPDPKLTFQLDIIPLSMDSISVVYQLQVADSLNTKDFTLLWESYASASDKEGTPFFPSIKFHSYSNHVYGTFTLARTATIIAAKVIRNTLKQAWVFFKVIDINTPLNGFVLSDNKVALDYVTIPSSLSIVNGKSTSTVFYYKDDFPPATPPFAETLGNINRTWRPDSVFSVDAVFAPFSKGLYLIQSDTSSSKGICIRAEDNYPKYSTLQNLTGPLTYITTKSEYDRLRNAQGDKKVFDKLILGITGNAERARFFMRNYFRRVEMANRFFTSYKEGWKTDRGMIYIIFGQANFVYRFEDREVWEYQTSLGEKYSFTFVKSSSLFDPENYVLIRKRSHQDLWLEAVDLNRNARF